MSKTARLPYDAAEFLDTEDDVVAYLNAAIEDGDAGLVVHALRNVARQRATSLKPGSSIAVDLQAVERALSEPGPVQLAPVLVAIKALGVKVQVARY